MYKPSDLRQFLEGMGAHPKKGLSQNFLVDGNIIRKIVETAHLQPDDLVLEIGPGPGALTEALLETGANIIAVEKDRTLAQALERLKSPEKHLEVFCQDILEFDFTTLKERLQKGKKAKVIANLPYHLTTPILVELVKHRDVFSSLVLMVQEEVARRFIAKPGTSDYSSLTVFLNFFSNPRYAFQVSRNCFYPKPKVESAVVVLDLKKPPNVSSEEKFFELTRTAFNKRRKMLRSSLRELYSPDAVAAALTNIGQNPKARPEELSLNNFLALFDCLT